MLVEIFNPIHESRHAHRRDADDGPERSVHEQRAETGLSQRRHGEHRRRAEEDRANASGDD